MTFNTKGHFSTLNYDPSSGINFQRGQFLYARLQTGRIMVWWCPSVRVSVRLSVRPTLRPSGSPSVRPGLRPSVRVSVRQFSTLFSNMLWHIELKFCIWLCFTVLQFKFEWGQFPSSFEGVMPLLELIILEIRSFPLFSLTCFDILSWNFANDFVLLHYRSTSSVVNLRQVLWELCPFWNLEYWKYTVFRTFLQHALTYWAEILHMTLFYCTTDQVWVLSICVNFCGSYATFGSQNTENTQFSALFSYMLWHIELKFCTLLCVTKIQIKFECRQFGSSFVGVMPLLELTILEIHSFLHFSLTCFDIRYWAQIFHMTLFNVLQIKFECRHSCPSILSEI